MSNNTPTPVPSEVAETTAGEREGLRRAEGHGCNIEDDFGRIQTCRRCAEPDAGEVEGLLAVILAASPGTPTLTCRRIAEAIHASPLLDRARREEGERIAQAIEADVDRMRSTGGGIYTADFAAGAQSTASIARAASVGRGEGL